MFKNGEIETADVQDGPEEESAEKGMMTCKSCGYEEECPHCASMAKGEEGDMPSPEAEMKGKGGVGKLIIAIKEINHK